MFFFSFKLRFAHILSMYYLNYMERIEEMMHPVNR